MGWIIFILIILLCIIPSNTSSTNTKTRYKEPRLSKRDIKKIKKAQRRAEMDAYEDMLMYLEVFSDD